MLPTEIIHGTVWQATGSTILARVVGVNGVAVTRSTLASITRKIWEPGGDPETPDADTLVISGVVFDTLQTPGDDPRWTADATGYNFRDSLAAADLSAAGQYWVEYTFTPASGEAFVVVAKIDSMARKGAATT